MESSPTARETGPEDPIFARLPDLDAILAARERIRPFVHRTPLLSSRYLAEAHGPRGRTVHLKAENLQRAGAFKIRGALHAMLRARARGELSEAGVLSYSSGNHGQAVALAASILGFRATLVAPEDIRPVKRRAIESYGASVVTSGLSTEDRRARAEELSRETGARIIPPYDHPDVIAGQGTVGLEILEDLREIDQILVPVGGGGLLSGIALAVKLSRPGVSVVGVEPEIANDYQLSLRAGERISIAPPRTVADGLRASTPGELTFLAARRFVDDIWTTSEAEILAAQRKILERAKLLVEPSGAVAVAAYLENGAELRDLSFVLVLSGGNTTLEELAASPGTGGEP